MLSWLLDASKGVKERRTVRELSIEMLGVNIGAIHTTTTVCSQITQRAMTTDLAHRRSQMLCSC